jgi:hypothetical protein
VKEVAELSVVLYKQGSKEPRTFAKSLVIGYTTNVVIISVIIWNVTMTNHLRWPMTTWQVCVKHQRLSCLPQLLVCPLRVLYALQFCALKASKDNLSQPCSALESGDHTLAQLHATVQGLAI